MSQPTRQTLANAIRILSADAVQQANSGHPGAPMGMADIAEVLWNDFLSHNPTNPQWVNRDRFVLSNGHGSMLQYSLLHLSGYDLSIDDLKNFRQLHSKTPGHPEYGYTPGVETTTGPLGQGVANAVGMALAEKTLAAQFNTQDHQIVDHNTYVFMGDGCMMEGLSHEVCSLAGTLKLGKLIAFWDDNGISIDGEVEGWFTDNTVERFKSYGWQVIESVDGHDAEQLVAAITAAKGNLDAPTLICCKTIIGKGAPNKQGKEDCHGAPLGDDEIKLLRAQLGWDAAPFEINDAIYTGWNAHESGKQREQQWQAAFDAYQAANPTQAAEFLRRLAGDLPANWTEQITDIIKQTNQAGEKLATRKASLKALNNIGTLLPELLGGSADLAGSNYTIHDTSVGISADDASGNYVYFGVREFGMAAILNGMSLYGGFKLYGGTFLVFSDYMRNGMRMSALMKQPVIYVLTHDSIGLGEDGPTHQPVEHVATLRLIPNMSLWRPCDAVESMVAWKKALEQTDKPSSLVFSRQGLPHQTRTEQQIADIEKGGYVLSDDSNADVCLIASGSEVEVAMQAATVLRSKGKAVRVVSMASTDEFDRQSDEYRASVLPAGLINRVAVEAGSKDYWYKYVGINGAIIGMDTFGESAPADQLYAHFNITTEAVVSAAEQLCSK